MWKELAEVSWFIFIIVIAVVAGFYFFPLYQYWAVAISVAIVFFGAIAGYILFEYIFT